LKPLEPYTLGSIADGTSLIVPAMPEPYELAMISGQLNQASTFGNVVLAVYNGIDPLWIMRGPLFDSVTMTLGQPWFLAAPNLERSTTADDAGVCYATTMGLPEDWIMTPQMSLRIALPGGLAANSFTLWRRPQRHA
jgi:hypothetical protein